MTKDEYIRELRSKLRFSLSAGEIRDIAGDISEVFADGIAEGRSEGEICTSLSSPADAARNILTEHGISPNTGTSLAKAVIFAVIMAAALYLLWSSPSVGIFAAAMLICAVLSVRVSRFGAVVPICGGLISAVIIGFMAYSAFHITERHFTDDDMSYEMMQIMYRSKFLNIFITALFIAMALTFITLAVRRDRLTLPCMYAVMGVMMILSKERGILRSLDPSMPLKSIVNYIPLSLIIAAAGMLILSAAADIYLIRRKAG